MSGLHGPGAVPAVDSNAAGGTWPAAGGTWPALAVERLRVGHRELGAFIDDVSLEIASGEVLALVGESGAGRASRRCH